MKVRKGDKLALLSVNNIYGVNFTCIVGELIKVEKKVSELVFHLKGKRSFLIDGSSQNLKDQTFQLSSKAFKAFHWTDATKNMIFHLRKAAQEMDAAQAKLKRKAIV